MVSLNQRLLKFTVYLKVQYLKSLNRYGMLIPPGFVVVSIPLPESLAPLISHISEYALLHPDHFHASYSQESFQSVLQSLTKGAGDS